MRWYCCATYSVYSLFYEFLLPFWLKDLLFGLGLRAVPSPLLSPTLLTPEEESRESDHLPLHGVQWECLLCTGVHLNTFFRPSAGGLAGQGSSGTVHRLTARLRYV